MINNDGSGYARLKNIPGGFFKYYQDDFGTELTDYFRVGEYNVSLFNELNSPIIEVYPNPAKNQLNIDFELLSKSDINMTIYDINGRVMLYKNISKSKQGVVEINLDDFKDGVYSCIIKTENNIYNKQIIVIK